MVFPDYDVRYIAINDVVDTFKSENELMAFKNIFSDWFARDTSKKISAVFRAKGQSGKPLTTNEALESSRLRQDDELKKAKKLVGQYSKRTAELDKLFIRLYEDNVSGKISDERFDMLSKKYETEQQEIKKNLSELTAFIESKEQKIADVTQFLSIVRKYTNITELTPEIMHEFIEKIVVNAPDKSSGHRKQQVDIFYRFSVGVSSVEFDSRDFCKKGKTAQSA